MSTFRSLSFLLMLVISVACGDDAETVFETHEVSPGAMTNPNAASADQFGTSDNYSAGASQAQIQTASHSNSAKVASHKGNANHNPVVTTTTLLSSTDTTTTTLYEEDTTTTTTLYEEEITTTTTMATTTTTMATTTTTMPVVIEPDPITIAFTSQAVTYGVSMQPYSYTPVVETNSDGYTLEVISGPDALGIYDGVLMGTIVNPMDVEYTSYSITLRATATDDPNATATQTFILRVDSVCQNSVINQVAILSNVNNQLVKTPLGSFASYSGNLSAVANYNYYSFSAHPVVGPAPQGYYGSTFMYLAPDGKSYLNLFWGVDNGGTSSTQVHVDVTVSGNNNDDTVLLSDDSGEMRRISSNAAGTYYQGRFAYNQNTDGAVIGPFTGENYVITVTMLTGGDNTNAKFYSQDGNHLTLLNNGTLSSYEISFQSTRTCQ